MDTVPGINAIGDNREQPGGFLPPSLSPTILAIPPERPYSNPMVGAVTRLRGERP